MLPALRLICLAAVGVIPGFLATACLASIPNPVIALHAKAHASKASTICGTWAPRDLDCTQFNIAGQTRVPYDVYVVAVNPVVSPPDTLPTVAGIRWAIDYDGEPHLGVDVFTWTFCGDLEFRQDGWPGAKTGNTLTWDRFDHCQDNRPGESGAQGVAGSFYLYAYGDDVFSVAPWYGWLTDDEGNWTGWQDPVLEVADCRINNNFLDLETGRGAVRFSAAGATIGFNPCTGEGELPPYGPPDPPIPPPPPPPPNGEHPATILLHVSPAGTRGGSCADAPSDLDSVKTSAAYPAPGALYDVYLLATPEVPHDSVGIAIIQMGIEYSPSLQVENWISCGSQLPFGEWPASGSGNTVIFDGCRSGEIEVAGYFRASIHDPAVFRIIGHPLTGVAKLADCTHETVLEDLSLTQVGWISLGGARVGQDADGCNPALESCDPGPVLGRPITWGKLKSQYK